MQVSSWYLPILQKEGHIERVCHNKQIGIGEHGIEKIQVLKYWMKTMEDLLMTKATRQDGTQSMVKEPWNSGTLRNQCLWKSR